MQLFNIFRAIGESSTSSILCIINAAKKSFLQNANLCMFNKRKQYCQAKDIVGIPFKRL